MKPLPHGWISCVTGDVAKVVGGGTPDTQDVTNFDGEEGIPWLTPADLSGFKEMHVSAGKRYLSEKGLRNSSAVLLPVGSVLFTSRAPIGYVAIASRELATNQGFKSFVCSEAILPEYLYFYLKFAKNLAEELASGTTFLEISGKNAAKIPLPLPPLKEQHRIVAKLEQLLNRVNAAQTRLAKIPFILKRFRQSVLAAACSGKLTADWRRVNAESESAENLVKRVLRANGAAKLRKISTEPEPRSTNDQVDLPALWHLFELDELCDATRGISYGVIKLGDNVDNGIACLRTSDVKWLSIETGDVKRIDPHISASYSRTLLKGGEILVNVRGTLGGVAIVPPELKGWNISREVAIVPVLSALDPQYVTFCIASAESQNWLTGVAKGVAYTGINLEDLRRLPVALPPLEEQHEIVRRVEALFETAALLKVRYQKATKHFDNLTQSILGCAFRGKLVSRDGNDESASVLLV